MAWCSNLTDEGLRHLSALSNLSELDISLTGITGNSNSIQHLSDSVRILDLSATRLSRDGIERLATTTAGCTKLTLRFLEHLTPQLFAKIVLQSPHLKFLDVTHSGPEQRLVIPFDLARFLQFRGIQAKGTIILPKPTTTTAATTTTITITAPTSL